MTFLLQSILTGLLYFLSAKLGLSIAYLHGSVSPVWIPTGIAIGSVCLFGNRLLPSVFLAAFFSNFYLTHVGLFPSLGIGLGNCLEAAVAGFCLKKFAPAQVERFDQIDRVLFFIAFACGLAPVVSATIGVSVLSLREPIVGMHFLKHWLTWWIGDSVGALLVAPMLFILSGFGRWRCTLSKMLEGVALFILTGISSYAIYYYPLVAEGVHPLTFARFLSLPVAIWGAYRFREHLTPFLLILFSGFSVYATLRGHGPFASNDMNDSLVTLQVSLIVRAITFYVFSALFSERFRGLKKVKRSEEGYKRIAERLETANQELNQFASSVSHDLRSPLRTISHFLSLITENISTKVDNETMTYLDFTNKASRRLERMVEDLLKMARFGMGMEEYEAVDLNKALEDAKLNLISEIEKENVTFEIGTLPRVQGSHLKFVVLFQNLLDNAIKFRREVKPVVKVYAEENADGWLIKIADNGIGIPEKFKERVFEPFIRLNSREKFEGSGLGLSTCRRVIESLGGRLWFQSVEGRGTTFFVLIPNPLDMKKPSSVRALV